MFYSHEVLTSRKWGVATIWLVATLGPKSSQRKVTRKDILKVDVPKVCETLIEPKAPLALRLQSNLLYGIPPYLKHQIITLHHSYGISRVYSQQCGYVLVDAQAAQNAMRQLLKTIKANDLDADPLRTKPDQLILSDDPAFLPDVAFGSCEFDLSNLEEIRDPTSQSSFFSPRPFHASQSSNELLPDIIIPSSGSRVSFRPDGDADGNRNQRLSGAIHLGFDRLAAEEDGFLPDIDFAIDPEGNLLGHGQQAPGSIGIRSVDQAAARSDTSLMEQVLREHEEATMRRLDATGDLGIGMDYNLPALGDDFQLQPDAEPFPPRQQQATQYLSSSTGERQHETSEAIGAPLQRRVKAPKILKPDVDIELRGSDLAAWRDNYLATMADCYKNRFQNKRSALAKSNVAFWTWGSGIGGVGTTVNAKGLVSPLNGFCGDDLVYAITGEATASSKKRTRDQAGEAEVEQGGNSAKSNRRSVEGEIARGERDANFDDDQLPPLLDDEPVEIGRNAPTPLPGDLSHDLSSTMPWNISAGHRSSSVLARARSAGPHHSASSTPLPGRFRLAGRASRRASPSPIAKRLGQELPLAPQRQDNADLPSIAGYGDDDFGLLDSSPRGGGLQFLASQAMNTQATVASKDELDQDSANLLGFIETAIANHQETDVEYDVDAGITYEELLPPNSTAYFIAAQGFLHTLTLATRGLLSVAQQTEFGEIRMWPASIVEQTHA